VGREINQENLFRFSFLTFKERSKT
jgi:hypothetical protein